MIGVLALIAVFAIAIGILMALHQAGRAGTINDVIQEQCEKHKLTIARRIHRTFHTDEYGVEHGDASAELTYFLDNVIMPALKAHQIAFQPQEYQAALDHIASTLQRITTPEDMAQVISPDFSDDMTGEEYEQFVAGLLTESGWSVAGTATTGDQGVDLIAERDSRRVAVQCKRYSGTVGNGAVQEAATGMQHYGCSEAWVVSNADYTPSARQLAATTGVRLLHHTELAAL